MIPLAFADMGATVKVERISGRPEVRSHLQDLGFVEGAEAVVVQAQDGDLIVNLMGTKLAITKEMAEKIMVRP